MEIITYVLSAIIIILLIIVLSMLLAIKKKDKDTKTTDMLTELKFQNESISKNLSNEFERNRRETAGFQNRVVDEMSKSLGTMADSLTKMTNANYENLIKLNENITSSLNSIKDNQYGSNYHLFILLAHNVFGA